MKTASTIELEWVKDKIPMLKKIDTQRLNGIKKKDDDKKKNLKDALPRKSSPRRLDPPQSTKSLER